MTRLQKQIQKLQNEINFANECDAKFQELKSAFSAVLKKSKLEFVEKEDNTFVDSKLIGEGLIFRGYIEVKDFNSLSDTEKNNLHKKLKEVSGDFGVNSLVYSSSIQVYLEQK